MPPASVSMAKASPWWPKRCATWRRAAPRLRQMLGRFRLKKRSYPAHRGPDFAGFVGSGWRFSAGMEGRGIWFLITTAPGPGAVWYGGVARGRSFPGSLTRTRNTGIFLRESVCLSPGRIERFRHPCGDYMRYQYASGPAKAFPFAAADFVRYFRPVSVLSNIQVLDRTCQTNSTPPAKTQGLSSKEIVLISTTGTPRLRRGILTVANGEKA
jgi:hypothetical protein